MRSRGAGQRQAQQRGDHTSPGTTEQTGHGIIGVVDFFGFNRTTQSPLLKSFT
jgi:hypothetical protein